jgi:hypothetical protein
MLAIRSFVLRPLSTTLGDLMSDALSFVEIVGQHVELLPARTVLSVFRLDPGSDDTVISNACTGGDLEKTGTLGTTVESSATCLPAVVTHHAG